MSWRISGTYYAPCSCNLGCPCTMGSTVADRGWCSGCLAFDIKSGEVDGVDVGGTKVVFVGDWPASYLLGNGTGRLYVDEAVTAEQRAVLEAVMSGRKGGLLQMIAAIVPNHLPTKVAPISIQHNGDETRVTVGEYGEVVAKPLRGLTGQLTRLLNGAGAFAQDIIMSNGSGSHWHDPEMRQWESGGHADIADFEWGG